MGTKNKKSATNGLIRILSGTALSLPSAATTDNRSTSFSRPNERSGAQSGSGRYDSSTPPASCSPSASRNSENRPFRQVRFQTDGVQASNPSSAQRQNNFQRFGRGTYRNLSTSNTPSGNRGFRPGNSYSNPGNSQSSTRRPFSANAATGKRCYNCGKIGHISKFCREQRKVCYSCGMPGHLQRAARPNSSYEIALARSNLSELAKCRVREATQMSENCTILVKIYFYDVVALLDSGARKSVIRESLVRRFRLPHTNVQGEVLYSATGEEIPVKGVANLDIGVNGFKMPGTFNIVKNLTHELILGCDFMTSNKVKHDFYSNSVTFEDDLVATLDYKIPEAHVRTIASVVIPPFTEAIVRARVDEYYRPQTSIIEPVHNLFAKRLALARCVVSPTNDKVIVRMLNPTASTVFLKKRTKIGTIEPIDIETKTDINAINNTKNTSDAEVFTNK